MNFENKTVLVTGANRGIGKAIVESLLNNGVKKVYAAARDISKLPNFGDDRVSPLTLDITNQDQIREAHKTAEDIDILINNAGVATFGSILDSPIEDVKRDMDTNYYGTMNMIREFVPSLKTKKDTGIVNIVTIGAFVSFPAIGGYCASKAALFSLSQGLRIDLEKHGIAVHTVNPGPIDTDMAKDFPTDKASPEDTANNIIDSLKAGVQDIFPDKGSQDMIGVWRNNYLDLENMISEMHNSH